MGKFKELSIEKQQQVLDRLKNRVKLEIEETWERTRKPIKYRFIFGKINSSLMQGMKAREFAELMDREGLIVLIEPALRTQTTWVMPVNHGLSALELDNLISEATIDAIDERRLSLSQSMVDAWARRKLDTD